MIFLIIIGLIVVGVGFWMVTLGRNEDSSSLYTCGLLLCFFGGGAIGTAITYLAGWAG